MTSRTRQSDADFFSVAHEQYGMSMPIPLTLVTNARSLWAQSCGYEFELAQPLDSLATSDLPLESGFDVRLGYILALDDPPI